MSSRTRTGALGPGSCWSSVSGSSVGLRRIPRLKRSHAGWTSWTSDIGRPFSEHRSSTEPASSTQRMPALTGLGVILHSGWRTPSCPHPLPGLFHRMQKRRSQLMNHRWLTFVTSFSVVTRIRRRVAMTIQEASDRLAALRFVKNSTDEVLCTSCVLPAASRGMGIFFCATRGSGKSRALGRRLAWQDFAGENPVPLVILDPVGGTIDNLLDKIRRLPVEDQKKLWPRVLYINMAGQDGRVVPWPIYYEARKGERFSDRAQRFVDQVRRVDPALQSASVQGFNALKPIAEAAGIVLSALGYGITEMWDLIQNPRGWESRLQQVEREHPETAAAVDELARLGVLSERDRASRLYSLGAKLTLFRFSPNFRAIFGATTPGINWHEVVEQKQAVLIDFRDISDPDIKKFCLLWVYNSFLTFVKQRGHGKMASPISFIIDELSYLISSSAVNGDLLT